MRRYRKVTERYRRVTERYRRVTERYRRVTERYRRVTRLSFNKPCLDNQKNSKIFAKAKTNNQVFYLDACLTLHDVDLCAIS